MAITVPIITDFDARGINKAQRQFSKLETKGQKAAFAIRKAALPAALALGAIALAAKAGVEGVMADDVALANLESTLKSTGHAANITAKGFFEFANQLQASTGVSATAITEGAAMLGTFKAIRNEVGKGNQVFDRATVAALDLSKKGFGSLESSNKMLGKALNDPIKGITALSRAGVTFTDEQKATIATLQETGDVLGAQKLILKEVESQVGGTAAAYGETTRGKIDRATRAFEELQKSLAQALLPAINFVAGAFGALAGWMQQNETIAKVVIATIAGLAAGILILNAAMKVVAATQIVLNLAMSANPIGIIIVAVAAFAAALVIAYNKSDAFRGVIDKIGDVFRSVFGWISEHSGPILSTLKTAFKLMFAPLYVGIKALEKVRDLIMFIADKMPNFEGTGAVPPQLRPGYKPPEGATGGIVTRPTLALIGEAGPEAVIPLNRTPGSSPLGGMGGITINVQAGLVSTPDQIGQQIIQAIQAAQRRSGPVFASA